jgi:hypothetical protein
MPENKWVDLHMHSSFSDGVRTPSELVALAVERGLSAIALADHDCLDGIRELVEAAGMADVEALAAVELSCVYRGRDLHILGYGVNAEDEEFRALLTRFRKAREERGVKIIAKLADMGVHLDAARILERAANGVLGRPHIAEALIDGRYVKDFSEAFEKYIGEDCPAYVQKYKMTPGEAVAAIRASGGLAFIAHPGFYLEDIDAFYELLEGGFDGIEVLHPKHDAETRERLRRMAQERGMLMSGGSDFHGFVGRDAPGEPKVPYAFYLQIKERLQGMGA